MNMNGHDLLSDPSVMVLAANVAAASLIVGLTALALRRCLHKRSLPLQHGVLAAAVAVLLLAPALFAVVPKVPGVGIRVDEWLPVEDQLSLDASSTDITPTNINSDNTTPNNITTGESADPWLDDKPPIPQLPIIPLPVNDTVFAEPGNTALNSEWQVVDEGADEVSEAEPDTNETTARMPVQDLASMPVSAPVEPQPVADEIAAEENHTSAPGFPVQTLGAVASVLLLVWLGGVAIGLLRCVCGFLLVARLRRRAALVDSPRIRSLVESVCSNVRLRRAPEILQTDAVDVPLTLGLLRPAIVLPVDLVETSSEARLRAMLLHESAHVARRDLWAGALQRLVGSLYWWNPLVHRVNRLLNDVRESLCDNHVLLAGGDGRDYADTLLTLAARIARPPRTASALGLVGRPSPGLSGRVTHLLERNRDMSVRLSAVSKRVLIVTACTTMCGLSALAIRGPERADGADDNGAALGQRVGTPFFPNPEYRKSLQPSIVQIEADVNGDFRFGSGLVVSGGKAARENGMQSVLTAARVLKGIRAGEQTVRLYLYEESEPRILKPASVAIDDEAGLAVICFSDLDQELPPVPLASSWRLPEIGDSFPFYPWNNGFVDREDHCVVIDGPNRPTEILCDGLPRNGDFGGGLFNYSGELIGLLVKADRNEQHRIFASLPAILAFLGIDEDPAAAEPPAESGVVAPQDPIANSGVAPVRFSEAREHVLSMGSLKFLLDLDTDQTMDPPARNRPGQEKMDVQPAQEQPYERPVGLSCRSSFLTGSPLKGIKVTPEDWNASVSDLQNALASDRVQPLAEMDYEAKGPATYFFRTGDGTDGILQLLAIVDEPKGIRVRYKVLSPVAEEPPAQSGAVAPQDPIASSGVVPLLLLSPDPKQAGFQSDRNEESIAASFDDRPKSVEWKSFISVRALFERTANIRWLADRLRIAPSEIEKDFQVFDFELQRQTRARADEEWNNWEQVDIQTAVDVLAQCAGYAPDVVPTGATSASITMPLPTRALGNWDYREVSHPGLQDRQPSADEVAHQNTVLLQLMKDVMTRRKSIPATPGPEGSGFSNVVFDTRRLVNELGEDVDLNLDFDQILFRYLDFDVSVGREYRYRVRVKFGTDEQNVLWTDWSDPTEIVSASGLPGTESSIALRDPRRRGDFRKLINRSIVRLEADVDGETRTGSGVVVSAGDFARESGMQSVLTSAHLLKGFEAGRDSLRVQFFDEQDPQPRAPDYVSVEEDAGLALVCFSNLDRELPTARLGSSRRLPAVDDEVTYHWWKDGLSPQFSERHVVAVNRYGGPSNLECDGLAESSGGGLFNGRGELVGICVAVDQDEQRTVFTALPAIFEFVGVDDEAAAEAPAARAGSEEPSSGLPGPPHIPVGGPGPGVLNSAVAQTGDTGGAKNDVILIELDADDDGALSDVHFLTRSLGSGDDALEELSRRLAAAAKEATSAQRKLQVQLSVDPGLKYASVVRVMEICREHDVADVRLSPQGGGESFVINIGFVRDADGKKLSETPVVFWGDSAHSPQDLSVILAGERRRRPGADVIVIIRADADVSTSVIQDVIRQAQAAGFGRFALRVLQSATGRRSVQGVVLEFDDKAKMVTISVGIDDGIRPQDMLNVYRGSEYIARIEVSRVEADRSVAMVREYEKSIAVGDHVLGPIRLDLPRPQTGDTGDQRGLGYDYLRTKVLKNIFSAERLSNDLTQRQEALHLLDDTLKLLEQADLNEQQRSALTAAVQKSRSSMERGLSSGGPQTDSATIAAQELFGAPVAGASEAGGQTSNPSRIVKNADEYDGPVVQVQFQQPRGMSLHLPGPGRDTTDVVQTPCRLNVTPGTLALKLTDIPGKAGLELYATIEIRKPDDVTGPYVEHNAVAIRFTEEDFSQAEANNFVVKVVYLPDPEFQELAVAGVETLVSTRVEPGVDPVAEADREGTILAVVRLGNRSGVEPGEE
jgi:beta-lactamase regulating signal transducer with metallopeptidase domain/biopolymer transport protein ExbD